MIIKRFNYSFYKAMTIFTHLLSFYLELSYFSVFGQEKSKFGHTWSSYRPLVSKAK